MYIRRKGIQHSSKWMIYNWTSWRILATKASTLDFGHYEFQVFDKVYGQYSKEFEEVMEQDKVWSKMKQV